MRRRPLLALIASSAAAVAGCSGNDGEEATHTRTDAPDPGPTPTNSETPEPGPTETETADSTALDVGVEPVEYLVETRRPTTGITHGSLVPFDDIPQILQEPLQQAVEGGYETEEVSRELLAAIDTFRTYEYATEFEPYVRIDGTAYEFEPTVPTFVASLPAATEETIVEESDPDRTFTWAFDHEFDSPAVETFVHVVAWRGNSANNRHEYRRSALPDPVEAFVSQYDYVEDEYGISELETEWRHEDPPYTLEAHELTPDMRWDREVLAVSGMEPLLGSTVREVLASPHREPATESQSHHINVSHDLPEQFVETFTESARSEQVPFVQREGDVYEIRVEETTPDLVPVSLSSTVVGDDTGTEAIELSVAVETDGRAAISEPEVRLYSRGATPTVLWIRADGERHLLDSDAYADDMWESAPDDPALDRRLGTSASATITPDSPLTAAYEIPADLPPGTYHSDGLFTVEWDVSGQLREAAYPFRCTIAIPGR